jgi:aminoglycoside phosphotransferase (APT) family kinase protein
MESGLYHHNYRFMIAGQGLAREWKERPLLLRLISEKKVDRTREESVQYEQKEAETLRILKDLKFKFSTPEFICMVNNQSGEIEGFIETFVRGIPLTLFRNSIHEDKIIPSIAEVAAAVHQVQPNNFHHLEAYPDNRTHIYTELENLPKELFDEHNIAQTVKRFILDHIPSVKPSVLLHGDLLPQNLICREDESSWKTSVIDWEFARIGDPAYDLSIVTRGDRKIEGKKNGLNLLLTSYKEAGGADISQSDVHIHELIMVLNWLWDSTIKRRKGHNGHGPDYYLGKIESILRRAEK